MLTVSVLKSIIFLIRNQFNEIIKAAYHHILTKTGKYLKEVLPSTGLQPHFSVAVDKSTPHRETNHAIVVIMPVDGKRIAVPVDAPLVYQVKDGNVTGGGGEALAHQVIDTICKDLKLELDDLCYLRGKFD